MSELHKFIFDGLPVRGIVVRLTDAWTEISASGDVSDYYAPTDGNSFLMAPVTVTSPHRRAPPCTSWSQ